MTGERDGADVTCDGRLFQKLVPETGKARLPCNCNCPCNIVVLYDYVGQ